MANVSVLIPTYKPDPVHLREALAGLLAQTEQDFECIICDEPTETDTKSLLGDILNDPRFRYIRNKKRLGIGGNWNACVEQARAPIVAFLFQDDFWNADFLQTALDIFSAHPNVGFVSMHHEYILEDDLWTKDGYALVQKTKKEIAPGEHRGEEFLAWWLNRNMHPNVIGEPPFVVLRREVIEEVGPFNERMPQFLDVEYWLRCLLVTDWYCEAATHGRFRVHKNGASAMNNTSGTGLYDRLTVYETLISKLSGELRRTAIASRNRSVGDMAKKFVNRMQHGKGVSASGSGQVIRFTFRHPIIVAQAILRALMGKYSG